MNGRKFFVGICKFVTLNTNWIRKFKKVSGFWGVAPLHV